MHEKPSAILGPQVEASLSETPVVALVGLRQCGNTTLANRILSRHPDSIRLDLEHPSDLAKLAGR